MPPNSRVRQRAVPVSPGWTVSGTAAQSVVPNGISLMCMEISLLFAVDTRCREAKEHSLRGALVDAAAKLTTRCISMMARHHGSAGASKGPPPQPTSAGHHRRAAVGGEGQ